MTQPNDAHHLSMLETFVKPMHPEGYKFVGIFAVITLVLFYFYLKLQPESPVGASNAR